MWTFMLQLRVNKLTLFFRVFGKPILIDVEKPYSISESIEMPRFRTKNESSHTRLSNTKI
jgi:hypothetical protein